MLYGFSVRNGYGTDQNITVSVDVMCKWSKVLTEAVVTGTTLDPPRVPRTGQCGERY